MKSNQILFTLFFFLLISKNGHSQCANNSNIYSFQYDNKTYEVVKEQKTWINAAACAVERGGYLAEINSQNEQNAIFNEVNTNAGININNTIAPDGGGSAYIWIGGNDINSEGNWVWNGNNDSESTQFWQGTRTGSPVGGLYNNWGFEPDNFNGNQDGLGLALEDWPLGDIGEWNDVNHNNSLYYIIEYNSNLNVEDIQNNTLNFKIYPNPAIDIITIEGAQNSVYELYASNGKLVKSGNITNNTINVSTLPKGIYYIQIENVKAKFVKK